MNVDRYVGARAQQGRGGRARLALAYGIPGKYHPNESQIRMTPAKLDQRAATSNLDVIAVRAQTEDRAVSREIGLESHHHGRRAPAAPSRRKLSGRRNERLVAV